MNQAFLEILRSKRGAPSFAFRKRTASAIFGYEPLEPRRLLAVASSSGIDDVNVLQNDSVAIPVVDVVAIEGASKWDYTPESDLLTVLQNKVPSNEVASLLREHLSLAQNDTMWLSRVQSDHLGFEHLKYRQLHRGLPFEL